MDVDNLSKFCSIFLKVSSRVFCKECGSDVHRDAFHHETDPEEKDYVYVCPKCRKRLDTSQVTHRKPFILGPRPTFK